MPNKRKRITDPMDQKVQVNIYMPLRYKQALNEYLDENPGETQSHFIEVAIRRELRHRGEMQRQGMSAEFAGGGVE